LSDEANFKNSVGVRDYVDPSSRQLGRLDELPAAYKNGLRLMCRELEPGK